MRGVSNKHCLLTFFIGLENQFSVFLRVAALYRYYIRPMRMTMIEYTIFNLISTHALISILLNASIWQVYQFGAIGSINKNHQNMRL